MAYMDADAPSVEPDTPSKDKKPTARLRKYWREIEAYNKAAQDWHKQADSIVKIYLDQHRQATSSRRFALLWSNIETLKPAVYAKTPNILCSRRHKDPDPIGRTAAEILERATNTTFDLYKADERFRMVRDDRLLVSRGTAWVRYEADTTDEKINYEKACIDYVHYKDFGHNVAGVWADVWLVWRKVYKTREECRERFGNEVAKKLSYTGKGPSDDDKESAELKACIYEIWDKKKNAVCFICKDCPDILEDGPPPTNFRDFFPCPEPCYGSKTTRSLFPVPDYRYYQDQVHEIDDLTQKIASLCDLLSPKGFFPAGTSADGGDAARIFIQSIQSQITKDGVILIPVEGWQAFAEKGGAKGLIEWMPVESHVLALKSAIEARNQLVQDVYQITGISDIFRGQSKAEETATAQQIKAETGGRRIRNHKDEIARFCKDIGQLVAEVIAEQFQPQTLADMSGFAYVPTPLPPLPPSLTNQLPQQQAAQQSPSGKTFDDKVLELLRNDRHRGFLIDIESDSTIQPDEDAEKQRRVEFVTAIGQFLKEALPAVQMAPPLVPALKESMMFLARGFRAGRNVEEVFEQSMDQLQQFAQNAAQQPNPEVQAKQAELQADAQKMQMQLQLEREKMDLEREKAQLDLQIKQAELNIKTAEAQANIELKRQEMQMKMEMELKAAALDAQIKEKQAAIDAQIAQDKAAQDANIRQNEAAAKMQIGAAEFEQKAQHAQAAHEDDRNMKRSDFESEQQRKAEAHNADLRLKEQASKAETETKREILKERAAMQAKRGPIKVKVPKRDADGRASEYELN